MKVETYFNDILINITVTKSDTDSHSLELEFYDSNAISKFEFYKTTSEDVDNFISALKEIRNYLIKKGE